MMKKSATFAQKQSEVDTTPVANKKYKSYNDNLKKASGLKSSPSERGSEKIRNHLKGSGGKNAPEEIQSIIFSEEYGSQHEQPDNKPMTPMLGGGSPKNADEEEEPEENPRKLE